MSRKESFFTCGLVSSHFLLCLLIEIDLSGCSSSSDLCSDQAQAYKPKGGGPSEGMFGLHPSRPRVPATSESPNGVRASSTAFNGEICVF